MKPLNGFWRLLFLTWAIVAALMPALSHAEITLDGTLGQSGALSGPYYTIMQSMGQTVGTNLFHSFGSFNVYTGESATFTGESSISNIIARVTEGGSSYIDGMISSAISGANLYFINPSGVVFGKNASLDIKGSFYVSTADYLKLSDGGKFNATNPSDTVLTVATPSAFGFLTSNPTGVSIEGSFLEVAEGKGITLVAGGIDIKNGYLYAPGGQINLAAVASAGEAAITSSGISVDAFSNFGDINISHTDSTRQTRNGNAIGNLDVSSTIAGAGNIYISGGKFITDGGQVCADTYGGGNGGGININVTGAISVTSGSQITSNTSSSGKAGDITITTESLTLTGNSLIGASALEDSTGDAGNVSIKASSTVNLSGHYYNNGVDSSSGIYSVTYGSGKAGNITIETKNLSITDDAMISASSIGNNSGDGGNISIKASDTVTIKGYFDSGNGVYTSGIYNVTYGAGKAGDISIETSNLDITDGGVISTSALKGSTGDGGGITINASDTVNISGHYYRGMDYSSGIYSVTYGSGKGGDITIETNELKLTDDGVISTSARAQSTGQSGNISIKASDTITISGHYFNIVDYASGIYSVTHGEGKAGDITIETGNLNITDGGMISSSVIGASTGTGGNISINAAESITISGQYNTESYTYRGGIYSVTEGLGDGGKITLVSKNFYITDGGTVSAISTGRGDAGSVEINTSDSFYLNEGLVETSSTGTSGGNISITGLNIQLLNGSAILSSVKSGKDKGGNVNILATTLCVLDSSEISADADLGYGGDITIGAHAVFLWDSSALHASSTITGHEGRININSPLSDITGSLIQLNRSYLQAEKMLPESCGAARTQRGSFVVKGSEYLSPQHSNLLF